MTFPGFIAGVGVLIAAAAASRAQDVADEPPPAPRVFVSGDIWTMEPEPARAEAIGVVGGRIAAIGTRDDVMEVMRTPQWTDGAAENGELEIIDLGGATVLPGLIDAHGHMAALGAFGSGLLDLSSATTFQDLVMVVRAAADRAAGEGWILGGRWDHESWPSKTLPTHNELSRLVPDRPVWLRRVDGHAGLANRKAMEIAGVTRDTPNPPGGEIVRDEAGEPTGVFIDNAEQLIDRVVDAEGVAAGDPASLLLRAQEMCLAAGLTGVHDAGISPEDAITYRALEQVGKLKIRVYGMLSAPACQRYFASGQMVVGPYFTARAAKAYMDGAMGSRGAWLLEPYSDRPTGPEGRPYTGLSVNPPAKIEMLAKHAAKFGYQLCVHAIGDRANRVVLDAFEAAIHTMEPGATMPRFRIEHAQLLHSDDLSRFAALGVIASMQPTHCTSDMRWVDARVGPARAGGAYAWASLAKSGAVLAFGSDFPVESHNPFPGIYAAVTRMNLDGEPPGGFHPEQALTREAAIRAFTLGAAYSAFEEDIKGSLKVGKLADFIVIDRDVMTCPPADIPGTRVLRTVVGGETVYRAGQ